MGSTNRVIIAIVVVAAVAAGGIGLMLLDDGGGDGAADGNDQPFTVSDDVDAPPATFDIAEFEGGVTITHDTGTSVYGPDGLYVVHDGERYQIMKSMGIGAEATVREGDLGTTFENGDTLYLIWDEGDGAHVYKEINLSNQ